MASMERRWALSGSVILRASRSAQLTISFSNASMAPVNAMTPMIKPAVIPATRCSQKKMGRSFILHLGPLPEQIVINAGELNRGRMFGMIAAEPLNAEVEIEQQGTFAVVAHHA